MKANKIISFLLFCVILLYAMPSAVIAGGEREYSWYCKRNGGAQPEVSVEEERISEYGGFSIDRSVSDTSHKKVIYLTFDAGYENGNVEKILDALKEGGVPAAFFILDNIILKNPDLVTRMANEGHLVCNHTKDHKNISSYTPERIKENLSALETLYEEVTGDKMAPFFRFPEGKYSIKALKAVSELGYKTVFWSFAYDDWDNARQMSESRAMKKILSNTHNGAVILLHPTSAVNAKIMPKLISEWKNMGYSFGTLNDLCGN